MILGARLSRRSRTVPDRERAQRVWLSDRDINEDPGAHTAVLLAVEIPAVLLDPFEWIEDGKPYREFLVPASVLNQVGRVTKLLEWTVPEPNYPPRPSEVSRRMSTLLGRGGA
jgi:hypothetical protein